MKTEKQKVIIVTVFHSLVSKNILNTNAIIHLRDSNKYKIILLVPKIKKTFFELHYAHKNIVIEGIDMQTFGQGWKENFMQMLAKLLIDTHYLHYKRRELRDSKKSIGSLIKYFIRELVVYTCAGKSFSIYLFHKIDLFFGKKDIYTSILNTYKPDLVFSTDIFEQMGAQLLRESNENNIKTIGMVRSWDNCLSKGLLRIKPEIFIVNNEVIKNELITIHGVSESVINVVGLPQFDSFISEKAIEKKVFFEKNNLDPTKKLIMFAPGGNVLSDTDPDICTLLIEAVQNGLLPKDVQIFVRNHPHHPANLDYFKNRSDIIVQSPGSILDSSTHKETELTPGDQDFLRNILAYTDVLVWVATSLCLDALVYDVPQVVVNFDGFQTKNYYQSVKRYHDEDHMKKMFNLKPFRVANNPEQLISNISMYLKDSSIDMKERELVKKQQFYKVDGQAGGRIAQILSDLTS